MIFDPKSLRLDSLFSDSNMFDSRKAWRRAGFDVLDPGKDTECMVAAHPSAPGYLFKKYADDVPAKEQRRNYEARVKGADKLARFIANEHLRHIVVPRKYLHDLPKDTFGRKAILLVVERIDLVGRDESEVRYKQITDEILRELLRVLVEFRGLDSNSKNVQFTRTGQIAFIDLENWDRSDRKEVRLKSIGSYLSKDKLALAERILDDLE